MTASGHDAPQGVALGILAAEMGRLLHEAGIEAYRMECAWLLEHVTGMSRAAQLARPGWPLDAASVAAARALAVRRAAREPLQYVLGTASFHGRSFAVSPSVLIPRPETETLVEAVLERPLDGQRVLDVGTGSGCIAVTISLERPGCEVSACDVSADALAVARANAGRLGARVRFFEADALDAGFLGVAGGPYDAVVSNPPYIPEGDAPALQPEVVRHEPHLALFAGSDPLRFHRVLARAAVAGLLVPGGLLCCELHDGTGEEAQADWRAVGMVDVAIRDDIAGRARVVCGRRGLKD